MKIDIKKIISNIWVERNVCYGDNNLHEKCVKTRKKLLANFDEKQTSLFYEFENISALLEIANEEELIGFVVEFMRAVFK